jgi:hypothetical protein
MKIPFNRALIKDFEQFSSEQKVERLLNCSIDVKPIKNNPKPWHNKIGYFPRITLIKSYNIDGSYVYFKIECSVPKILFDNNIYEYSEEYFYLFLWVLQDKLWRMGLWIEIRNIENAYISRIDFSKNIILPNNCHSFIRYVNKIPLDSRLEKTETSYDNKGYGSKQYSNDFQISVYDKGLEFNKALYSGDKEHHLESNRYQQKLDAKIRHNRKNILKFEISFFKKRKLKELCETLNIDAGEYRLHNLLKPNISKTILQHYAHKITSSIRKLNLDSIDEMAMLDRIQKAYPKAENNKILRLFTQNILFSKYGTELFQHRFGYKSDELCKLRGELQQINSTENSSFSSIMENINAVEDCLEEFSPLKESDFLMCENG